MTEAELERIERRYQVAEGMVASSASLVETARAITSTADDVPLLVAEVRRLRELVERVRSDYGTTCYWCGSYIRVEGHAVSCRAVGL